MTSRGHDQGPIHSEILFLVVVVAIASVSSQAAWVTVMAITNSSGSHDAFSLLMSQGSLNEAASKELWPANIIVSAGDFKSAMLDNWTAYRPAKVRLALLSSQGGTMWYAEFNHTASSDKDPQQWLATSSLSAASDPSLAATDLSIVFNQTTLLMSVNNGSNRRLQMTWLDSPLFLFCTSYQSVSPSPLTAPDDTSNRDMLTGKLNEPYYTFRNVSGSSIWMKFSRPVFFIGISFNKTGSGQIVKFRLYSSIEPDCDTRYQDSSIFEPYLDDNALSPKIFLLKYNQGESNTTAEVVLDTTVAGICLWISVVGRLDPAASDISVYATSYDTLEAAIFVLQWWIDPYGTTVAAVLASTTNTVTTPGCTTVTVCEATSSPFDVTANLTATSSSENIVSDPYQNVISSSFVAPSDDAVTEAVRELQARLKLPKGETGKFKRQFVSVSDTRPSAVFLGVVGAACICAVLLGVLALDFTHIARDAKAMMDNIRGCSGCLEKEAKGDNSPFNSGKPEATTGPLV